MGDNCVETQVVMLNLLYFKTGERWYVCECVSVGVCSMFACACVRAW